MGYVDQNLLPGEVVVHRARLHGIIYAGPIVLAVIALILVIVGFAKEGAQLAGGIGLFLFVVAGAIALGKYITARTSEFAVTNRRVLIKVGAISRHTLELLLQKVEGIGVDQDLLGRMFGFGDILVTGTGGTKERFSSIADPLSFRREVQNQTHSQPSSPAPPELLRTQKQAEPFCTNCGAATVAGGKFCSACGQSVSPN